jgi:hypothetical protein
LGHIMLLHAELCLQTILGDILFFAFAACPSVFIRLVWRFRVKLLVGLQPYSTGVFSTIPSCARHLHIPLRCSKWPPELKLEKSCLTFTGQTTGGISTKLYRSNQYHP